MDSPRRYSLTFLATPAVSRKTCGSKESAFPFFLRVLGFIVGSKPLLHVLVPVHVQPTKKPSAKLCKREQSTLCCSSLKLATLTRRVQGLRKGSISSTGNDSVPAWCESDS